MGWNYGDILDAIAPVVPPDHPALVHGDRTITWESFDRRTNRLARALLAHGLNTGDKVAIYMRNRPEYMECVAACFKARLVHVNVNYRYREEELHYLLDDSDAAAVIFEPEFAELATALQPRLPKVQIWAQTWADGPAPDFAYGYEAFAGEGDDGPLGIERSPDDLFFIYTGGTTGMPKGVMWRADDLRQAQLQVPILEKVPRDLAEHVDIVATDGPGTCLLPACPQMHGTGLVTSVGAIAMGGTVVTMEGATFYADELWDQAAQNRVQQIAIVGDVFANPMLEALERNPGAYDLSNLAAIVSSGVMWSIENKRGLLRHLPQVAMLDSFGASEAVGFGLSVTTADGEWRTAKFELGEQVKVFTEDGREVTPGSDEPGQVARSGPIPVGYYKDPEKTASTFKTIDGVRYSIPGDWCRVEADGGLTLLGRGSVCINTGGEKVFPEEVEEVLKQHPDVADALVVGVPDPRWGQAVTGIVQPRNGATFDETGLRAYVRGHLAGYKTPKRILPISDMARGPNGKADYKKAAAFAQTALTAD